MSKAGKKWLTAAAVLIVIGFIMIVAVSAFHWEFDDLSTDQFETNTYEILDEFSNLDLDLDTADLLLVASGDSMCRVVCYEDIKMEHSVEVRNGTLRINVKDGREWLDYIGIHLHSPKITVYLPKAEYVSLGITGSTGDIEITDELMFDHVDISQSTSDITVCNLSVGTLSLSASTGEIAVSNVNCMGDFKTSVTTGNVNLRNITCQNLLSSGSTGDISLRNVTATKKFSIERSTGDVVFDCSDAARIVVETSMGNVTGSFLTEKFFITNTSTGDISVPKTSAGGKCEIRTSTGDIRIEIAGCNDA